MNVFTKYIQMYDSFIRSRVKESTAIRKNQNIRFFIAWLENKGFSDLNELSTADVYAYINSLKFRPNSNFGCFLISFSKKGCAVSMDINFFL